MNATIASSAVITTSKLSESQAGNDDALSLSFAFAVLAVPPSAEGAAAPGEPIAAPAVPLEPAPVPVCEPVPDPAVGPVPPGVLLLPKPPALGALPPAPVPPAPVPPAAAPEAPVAPLAADVLRVAVAGPFCAFAPGFVVLGLVVPGLIVPGLVAP